MLLNLRDGNLCIKAAQKISPLTAWQNPERLARRKWMLTLLLVPTRKSVSNEVLFIVVVEEKGIVTLIMMMVRVAVVV